MRKFKMKTVEVSNDKHWMLPKGNAQSSKAPKIPGAVTTDGLARAWDDPESSSDPQAVPKQSPVLITPLSPAPAAVAFLQLREMQGRAPSSWQMNKAFRFVCLCVMESFGLKWTWKSHLVPPEISRDSFHQITFLRAPSNMTLNVKFLSTLVW